MPSELLRLTEAENGTLAGKKWEPDWGGAEEFQSDPHRRDNILFYEYFHGDTGKGLGASHQTGWTGLVARSLHLFGTLTPEMILNEGKQSYVQSATVTSVAANDNDR